MFFILMSRFVNNIKQAVNTFPRLEMIIGTFRVTVKEQLKFIHER